MVAPGEVARRPVAEDADQGHVGRALRADERDGVADGVAATSPRRRSRGRPPPARSGPGPRVSRKGVSSWSSSQLLPNCGAPGVPSDRAVGADDAHPVDEHLPARLGDTRRRRGTSSSMAAGSVATGPPRRWPPTSSTGRDDDVRGRVGEQVGERAVEGVGEDQGADDEADAQHDRQAGQDQAQLVVDAGCARRFAAWATTSGPCRRSPSCDRGLPRPWGRPSCRRSGRRRGTGRGPRSDAAVGSWVTMTIVWPKSSTLRRRNDEHLGAGARVEVAGRLVGEDDLRPAGQRPRGRDPLLLAAGELARPVAQPVAQADGVDDRCRPTPGRRGGPRCPSAA